MGSKYSDEVREQALAMLASGLSVGKVAGILKIPRSTLCDWQARASESDEDFVAARREERRKMVGKSWGIVKIGMAGIETQAKNAKAEKANIARVIARILAADTVDEDTAQEMVKIVRDYSGVSLTELSRVTRDAYQIYGDLESGMEEADSGAVEVTFGGALALAE